MSDDIVSLAAALAPLTARVRTDVTAVKKPNGEQAWTRQALTPERLARHFNGGPPRGVSPIKAGEDVTMVSVLDFDSHGGEVPWPAMGRVVHDVADVLEMHGMQPVVWRSSGGRGLHLYLMWDQPQPAAAVREFMTQVLATCNLKNGAKGVGAGAVEVFPKQDRVPVGGFGNQFILPLAGKSELLRWEDLTDEYVPVARTEISAASWGPPSSSVPTMSSPESTRPVAPPVDPTTGHALWREALDAIPNGRGGSSDLDYDGWRNVIFAIHHETKGSDDGLRLAHEFSARSPKYTPDFLDNRVWPYVTSDRGSGVITGRTIMSIAGHHGWHEPIDISDFDVIAEEGETGEVHDEDETEDTTEHGTAGVAQAAKQENKENGSGDGRVRGAIPEAKHLTTDQANANRIVAQYGKKVMVSAGRWHVYDGKRWLADEADIYRFGCNLSKLVGAEAEEFQRKAARLQSDIDEKLTTSNDLMAQAKLLGNTDPRGAELARRAKDVMASIDPQDAADAAQASETGEKLQKWAARSEMRAGIEAAIGLARKMLTIDARALDADHMALNCSNGTVDLFSGDIKPHKSKDLITKLVDVEYRGDETHTVDAMDRWANIVADITGEHTLPWDEREIAKFLQRWFGYCATGSVREQVLVVHWGSGRNGKSTIIETVRAVLGEYAGTAAPGLLTNDGKGFERHPTEVASLLGKRMITAHENEENAVLREGFIKQATGGDQLKARYMREDFFDFDATHKLQLLTNHKPQIRGTDPGIWRRVLLVPYTQSFGSKAQFERGEVTRVADKLLGEALKADPQMLRGVLAWVVAGAIEWAQHGLQPPESVLAASKSYQDEMDRVGQFVRECCETAPPSEFAAVYAGTARQWCEPLTHGMGGLYPAYQSWCKEGGFHSLSRLKFVDSLKTALPACAVIEGMDRSGEKRRKVLRVFGVRLLSED